MRFRLLLCTGLFLACAGGGMAQGVSSDVLVSAEPAGYALVQTADEAGQTEWPLVRQLSRVEGQEIELNLRVEPERSFWTRGRVAGVALGLIAGGAAVYFLTQSGGTSDVSGIPTPPDPPGR
ncbi:MAG: hypothetical protein AAF752_03860 [Bacteroidota bacterium]